jgi:hypothetical protein
VRKTLLYAILVQNPVQGSHEQLLKAIPDRTEPWNAAKTPEKSGDIITP